ncbi:CDGSH iron-sulfur domain-containing protein [Nocardioides sp. MAHUQ-72]|uniref:CDGSH iron-sulfur domain-containing protein n=1 Tax=unclassified Nocardioides TaxID=2615069 RepID=UPI0036222580
MSAERPRDMEHPDVVICPGGPLLLRGDHVVQDDQGRTHRTTRPVSAVCRCGKSAAQPWCDGTHKVLPAKARP